METWTLMDTLAMELLFMDVKGASIEYCPIGWRLTTTALMDNRNTESNNNNSNRIIGGKRSQHWALILIMTKTNGQMEKASIDNKNTDRKQHNSMVMMGMILSFISQGAHGVVWNNSVIQCLCFLSDPSWCLTLPNPRFISHLRIKNGYGEYSWKIGQILPREYRKLCNFYYWLSTGK